uniref:Large ribosomal subunit protein P1 n=1 Tax=Cricetulus griseus TaxID=10029 RepID=A0A8C2MEW6_CRIGR
MASVSELAYIYSALILHHEEVTVTKDKINAMANVNIGSLICNIGAGGPAPAAGAAPAGGPAPSTAAAPVEEKKLEAKKEESEESDDDMGFGLFD